MRQIIALIALLAAPAAFGQAPEAPPAERTEAAREEPADVETPEDPAQPGGPAEDGPVEAEGAAGEPAAGEPATEERVPPPAGADTGVDPQAPAGAGAAPEDPAESPTAPGEADASPADPGDGGLPPPTPQPVPEVGGASAPAPLAEGSAEAGREKSSRCAACHGVDGNSFNPEWPSLAGQHAEYIVRQLEAYQSGARQDVLMTPQAQGLSEQDMQDLAAYYAAQVPALRTADPELARLGQSIYRGGNPERSASACIACHGPTGAGNPAAGYPMVRGQHAVYLTRTLQDYASGERRSDPNQMMRNIAVLLDDDEIAAVSSYMQGLRSQ